MTERVTLGSVNEMVDMEAINGTRSLQTSEKRPSNLEAPACWGGWGLDAKGLVP